MAITLTLADAQDGATMTATIAGVDVGASVSVYTQAFDIGSAFAATTWTLSGTRAGNGNVTLTLSPGYYWVYATGNVSGTLDRSVPVYGLVSRSAYAIQDLILDAVVARLQTLSFTGLNTPPGDLTSAMIERVEEINHLVISSARVMPRIYVCQNGGEDNSDGQTTAQDDIGYPVVVAIVDRAAPEEKTRHKTYLKWRQQIRRALISQRLPGVTQQHFCRLIPTPAWVRPEDKYDHLFSAQAFRFVAREPRGV